MLNLVIFFVFEIHWEMPHEADDHDEEQHGKGGM